MSNLTQIGRTEAGAEAEAEVRRKLWLAPHLSFLCRRVPVRRYVDVNSSFLRLFFFSLRATLLGPARFLPERLQVKRRKPKLENWRELSNAMPFDPSIKSIASFAGLQLNLSLLSLSRLAPQLASWIGKLEWQVGRSERGNDMNYLQCWLRRGSRCRSQCWPVQAAELGAQLRRTIAHNYITGQRASRHQSGWNQSSSCSVVKFPKNKAKN